MEDITKENKKSIYNSRKILILMFIVSVITSLLILFHDKRPEEYDLLFFLPVTFLVIVSIFLTGKKNILSSITKTIIFFGYFLRMTITPLIMRFGNYSSKVTNVEIFENMEKAILLVCYEALVVFFILFIINNKKNVHNLNDTKSLHLNIKTLFMIIILLLVIVIGLMFKFPELKEVYGLYLFYSNEKITEHDVKVDILLSTLPSLVYPVYKLIVDILRELIPICLIFFIKDKNTKNEYKSFWISVIIAGVSLLFMSDDRAVSLYLAISLILIIQYLYPKYIKHLIKLSAIIGVLMLAVLSNQGSTSKNKDTLEKMSDSLQAYFGGVDNVAVANNLTTFNIGRIPINTGKSITIVSYFFKEYKSMSYIFNTEYHGFSGRTNQIIPLIGEGYYYFGFILAPLLHIMVIKLSLYIEKKSWKTDDILKKYICVLACIILSVTPIMYNWVICVNLFTSLIIPIFVICKVSLSKNGRELCKEQKAQ